MKKNLHLVLTLAGLSLTTAAFADDVAGIVTARLVQPDGQTVAFVLVDPAKPTVAVTTSGADAAALTPRNQVTLSGAAGDGAFGKAVQATAGSVKIGETNQPFKSQTITAAALKDAAAIAGNYVQLPGVTFVAEKFDASGSAQAKAEDGSIINLLVSKGVAGHEMPKGVQDVFGVVVKQGDQWKIVAARFLPANRKAMTELATKATCITCHNPDTKVVGPSYREVAAHYRNDPEAVAKLVAQMKNGGTGKWGQVPMPPLAATVPPDDMQKLADWVLSYRWDALLAE